MTRLPRALLTAIFISSGCGVAVSEELTICEQEMAAAAKEYNLPLGVLYAVGLTETGGKKGLRPYAMNIAGKPYFANDPQDAIAKFNAERAKGVKLIDLGCMQINHHYHREKFASLEEMLDPYKNVRYAARFLTELREREGSWTMAVARYHAGPNNNPAQKRYVCLVIRNMVKAGFGSWTANSSAFCGQSEPPAAKGGKVATLGDG